MKKKLKKLFSMILTASIVSSSFTAGVLAENNGENINGDPVETVMRYTDRYLIKYREETDGQMQIEEAVQKAKEKKNAFVEEARAQLEKADDRKKQEMFEQSLKSVGFKAANALTVYDGLLEETAVSGYRVICIDEKVDPEIFMQEMTAENQDIEYIQPDYIMELSAAEPELSMEPVITEPIPASSPAAGETIVPEGTPAPDVTENPTAQAEKTPKASQIPAETPVPTEEAALPEEGGNPGRNAVVALIDTGVDTQHPSLAGHMIQGYDFCNDTDTVTAEPDSLADTHGTHLAGVIAQTAPQARIMPLKVFENGRAYTSDIIEAIAYAQENGADIVNCSWGSTEDNRALYETMQKSGLLFVCAAGNHRRNVEETPVYPGAFDLDNIMNVTSVNDDFGMSYFSNYGVNSVDIAVLGRDVEGPLPGGKTGNMSGTSVSAAMVTGALAAYAQSHDISDGKEMLMMSADRLSSLQNRVSEARCLNLEQLLSEAPGSEKEAVYTPDYDVFTYTPSVETWETFSASDKKIVSVSGAGKQVVTSDGLVWNFREENGALVFEEFPYINDAAWVYSTGRLYVYVKTNGELYTYKKEYNNDSAIPEAVTGIQQVTKVAPNGDYMLIEADGSLYGWGENHFGQAGHAEVEYDEMGYPLGFYYKYIPSPAGMGGNNKQIHACGSFSMAIDSENNLWTWGEDESFGSCDPAVYASNIVNAVDVSGSTRTAFVTVDTNDTMTRYEEHRRDGLASTYSYPNCGLKNYEFLESNVLRDVNKNIGYWEEKNGGIAVTWIKNLKNIRQFSDSYALAEDGTLYQWNGGDTAKALNGGGAEVTGTVIIDEQYNTPGNAAYKANQETLKSLGWSENDPEEGEFSAQSGRLIIKKKGMHTVGSADLAYSAEKIFTQRTDNWKNDNRVSVWTNHFKGRYGVEITGSFMLEAGQGYYDIMGATNTGTPAVVARYKIDPGYNPNRGFYVYNNMLNGGNTRDYMLWTNPEQDRTIRTVLNSDTATFYTTLNGSMIPEATTVEGANPTTMFNMTDWNQRQPTEYITGIRFSAQDRELGGAQIARLDSVKLIEYEKADDVVEDAVESMSMSDITGTPGAVTQNLTLPAQKMGANITWTSSRPDIISNSGVLVGDPAFSIDVTMTANITNPADGFTKHMDFRLTVPRRGGFEETYTGNYQGTPSSADGEGTKAFAQLPMWRFSYPGIENGTNWQLHASQVLVKNGYLTYKKLSDRQTDNYQECLTGIRSLSNSLSAPLLSSVNIGVTAKVYGTGTMRLAPLTAEGNPVCTLILDASTKHIEITYGEDNNGSIVNTTRRIDSIDPRTDKNYELELKDDETFNLYVDGELIGENMHFQKEAGASPKISKLKTWITNITYQNTEIGYIKRLVVTNAKAVQNADLQNVWEDIDWLTQVIPRTVTSDMTLPATGQKGASAITWTSSQPRYIAPDGTVTRPADYLADTEVILTATVRKGSQTKTYQYPVRVLREENTKTTTVYPADDTMIWGGFTGLTGTERYGRDTKAKVNTVIEDGNLSGNYALLKFDLSGYTGDALTASLNLYRVSGTNGLEYKVAIVNNDALAASWSENALMYQDVQLAMSDLTEIGGFTLKSARNSLMQNISIDITEQIQEIKENTSGNQTITLCVYSAQNTANDLEITMKEWDEGTAPGTKRPCIMISDAGKMEEAYEVYKDVPMRTMGYEYEQTYEIDPQTDAPQILSPSVYILDKANGIYRIKMNYTCDESASPFFFWSAMEGVFEQVNGNEDFSEVIFKADPGTGGRKVKVVLGIGDGLGRVDKKAILLDGSYTAEERAQEETEEKEEEVHE